MCVQQSIAEHRHSLLRSCRGVHAVGRRERRRLEWHLRALAISGIFALRLARRFRPYLACNGALEKSGTTRKVFWAEEVVEGRMQAGGEGLER